MSEKKLEDFRNEQLVGELGIISKAWGDKIIPFLFHDTVNSAFYMTIDALNRMQKQNIIGANNYCLPAIGLWFIATESYISTIYKILQENQKNNQTTTTLQASKIVDKFTGIIRTCSPNEKINSDLKNKLQEFTTFRNTLFHDLTFTRSPHVYHTKFTPFANKLNEVDLMQAVVISIEVFTYFRNTLNGIDLMPNVFISNQFEKVDVLYNEIIKDTFSETLKSKDIKTALSLEISNIKLVSTLKHEPVNFIISHEGPEFPSAQHNGNQHTFAQIAFQKAVQKRPMAPDKFGIPNYKS